jgi:DNA-binding CsgD family transcriptional regulator
LIGWIALCQGEVQDAEQLLADCRADAPDIPSPVGFSWGAYLLLVHRDQRAIAVFARARAQAAAEGDRGAEAITYLFEALAAAFLGSAQIALAVTQRCLNHAVAAGAPWAISWAMIARGIALTHHGDPRVAVAMGREVLGRTAPTGDQWGSLWAAYLGFWSQAELIARGGTDVGEEMPDAMDVARQIGGGIKLCERIGVKLDGVKPFTDATDRAIRIVRGALGADDYAVGFHEGYQLEFDELLGPSMGELDFEAAPPAHVLSAWARSRWQLLTAEQKIVARMAAAGMTNEAIAVRLGKAKRTVERQLYQATQKLEVHSRKNIAPFVPPAEPHRPDRPDPST